tara:strand:+ start:144 stop:866 length:723 start_codon:yes stop_codon:yes gene_type:complete
MKILDLFSGIGGFSLAAEWAGYETVGFCEIDVYCQKVLKKNFPDVPIFDDIRKLNRSDINGAVDVITGGFPCQPFSVAGRKKGTQDDRDLWPQMFRVIKEFKPTWIIGENVANFISMAFQRTKTDLEGEGYEVQPFIIPACAVNAPHRRDRAWIVAYSNGKGLSGFQQSNTNTIQSCKKKGFSISSFNYDNQMALPNIPKNIRVDDGVPNRVDRIKGLGNAIVPQVAYQILKAIKKSKKD